MVRRIVPYVSNTHHLKESLVCIQDVVATRPQQSNLLDLGPNIQVSEPQALEEATEEDHYPKLHQQISNFMTARVMGLSNVGIEIPYNYGILVPETGQSILQIREVLRVGGGEILSDK